MLSSLGDNSDPSATRSSQATLCTLLGRALWAESPSPLAIRLGHSPWCFASEGRARPLSICPVTCFLCRPPVTSAQTCPRVAAECLLHPFSLLKNFRVPTLSVVLWDHHLSTVAHYKFRDLCGPQGLAGVQCVGLNLDLNLNVNLGCCWGGAEETGKLAVEMRTLLERHGHTEPRRDTAHSRQAV